MKTVKEEMDERAKVSVMKLSESFMLKNMAEMPIESAKPKLHSIRKRLHRLRNGG